MIEQRSAPLRLTPRWSVFLCPNGDEMEIKKIVIDMDGQELLLTKRQAAELLEILDNLLCGDPLVSNINTDFTVTTTNGEPHA